MIRLNHVPDTVITLTTGQILRVRETAEEVVERVVGFRRRIFAGPEEPAGLPELPEELDRSTMADTPQNTVQKQPKPPGARPDFATIGGIGVALAGILGGLLVEKGSLQDVPED
jgi:hypothetical protein